MASSYSIKNNNHNSVSSCFHAIHLLEGFQHAMQTKEALILTTSNDINAEMYGFRFIDEEKARSFSQSLLTLGQYKQRSTYCETLVNKENVVPDHKPNSIKAVSPPLVDRSFAGNPPQNLGGAVINPPLNLGGTTNPLPNLGGVVNPSLNLGGTTNSTQNLGGTVINPSLNLGGTVNSPSNLGGIVNPPDVRRRIQRNDHPAYKDPDKLNELISQNGSKDREEETLCDTLTNAIECGDVEKAKDIVVNLVNRKMKLKASPIPNVNKLKINLHINVESKDNHLDEPIILPVDPHSMTIRHLKEQIHHDYDFPTCMQRFIIKNRLARDDETLIRCGVKTTENIYLYLKAIDDTAMKSKEIQTDTPGVQNTNTSPQRRRADSNQQYIPPTQGTFPPQDIEYLLNKNLWDMGTPPRQDFMPMRGIPPTQGFPPRLQMNRLPPNPHFPQPSEFGHPFPTIPCFPRPTGPVQPAYLEGAHGLQGNFSTAENSNQLNHQFAEINRVFQRPVDMNLNAIPDLLNPNATSTDISNDILPGMDDGWDCHLCTFRNISSDHICVVCNSEKLNNVNLVLPPDLVTPNLISPNDIISNELNVTIAVPEG